MKNINFVRVNTDIHSYISAMNKTKICIEHELRSRSANIIWPLISSKDGLKKWMADEVTRQEDTFTFTWGEVWKSHETRTATVIAEEKGQMIRIRWDDEEDANAYVELRTEKGDITNDYILIITDFAEEDEIDSLKGLWQANLERLHQNTGL